MSFAAALKKSFSAALPVILGYVAIGIPCGIMEQQIGMNALMAFAMSVTFYSGAGQFMIPGMWLAGAPLASIIASVSFVNTRQMLYSTAFSPFFQKASKLLTFVFSATVTDESFGVNMQRFVDGKWTCLHATLVNLCCMMSWAVSNAVGVLVGSALSIPTAIAAFAMTSIFICLLVGQRKTRVNAVTVAASMAGVVFFKSVGLTGPAILLGACVGVGCGMAAMAAARRA